MVKYSPTRRARIFPGNGWPEYSLPYSEIAALYENGTLIRDLAGRCYRHATPPAEPPPTPPPVPPTGELFAPAAPPSEPSLGHPPPLTNEQLIATAEAAAASASTATASGPPAEVSDGPRVYIYAPNTAPALVAALLAERKGSYRFFPHSPIPAGFNIPCSSVEGAQAYARVLQRYGIFCEVKAPFVSKLDLHWGPAPRTSGPPVPLIRNLTSAELDDILAERPPSPAAEPEPGPAHLHLTTPCK